ncbi:hypothetical protein [Yinghuangia soli]|uniref:Uncharacterized protein n=1 Tax=Yinghuangia soli TaxID=2908204 RepID=A0AA41PZF9_9ACTN|nr:hypothetical protein [Yinghuangia soli]MCF2528427.1 hypothetical protein [Yinghuangia soli]
MRTYQALEFDVAEIGDADGFLFQYGGNVLDVGAPFALSFVRQLEQVDADGEFVAFFQVGFAFKFAMDADLKGLQNSHDWWFRGQTQPFDEWLAKVSEDRVWPLVRDRGPSRFDIVYGQV